MNIHLGATKKSLPTTPANREPDRSDTGSERDSNKALTAPNVLMVFPKFNSHSFWNLQEVCEADIDWADMVMTGGMFPQQADTFIVIKLCHSRGKPVVVGGPAPTSSPQIYGEADFLVLGEAEGIIDQFIE